MLKNAPGLYRSLLGALVLAATAAAGVVPAAAGTAPAASAGLPAAIRAEVKEAACDSSEQCHSVAIGAKPCGGPDGYLAWSSKQSDEVRLAALLERHAAARKRENLNTDERSNCMMETNPGATCQAGRCTLQPRGVGARARSGN